MLFLTYYKKLRKLRGKKGVADGADAADAAKATKETEKATKETEKDIKRAIEMVAEKLHNSYSICKKSYIDPKIIEEVLHKN
jgi:DNA topoisomerase IB